MWSFLAGEFCSVKMAKIQVRKKNRGNVSWCFKSRNSHSETILKSALNLVQFLKILMCAWLNPCIIFTYICAIHKVHTHEQSIPRVSYKKCIIITTIMCVQFNIPIKVCTYILLLPLTTCITFVAFPKCLIV